MYRSVYYNSSRSEIHLWGDGQHDDSGYKVFKYEPYAYIVDKNGDCITIDNHRCKKVSTWSPEAEKMGMVYEHNVSPTTRFLIDKYLDSDKVSDQTKILYLDIEVAKEDAYSTPEDADNTVTAITYVATGDDKYTCLLLDPGNASTKNTTVDIQLKKKENGQIVDGETKTIDVDIITFHSERELLRSFMMRYQKIGHNIITGWNVEFFDMPYLYNRIVKLFDYAFADLFSPDAKIVKRTYLKERQTISIAGVTIYDYLTMYRKFTFTDQSNYRLDTIAKFELYRGIQ
jgi:DNA polymerase elongation subunit (family B)